jgi:hypothetical protein
MKNSLLWEGPAAMRLPGSALSMALGVALRVSLGAALVLTPVGCKNKKVKLQATEEEAPRMASAVSMGDPKAETQLINGFYGVEAGAWRWTAKQFTLVLRPPAGSAEKGGKLQLKLTVPPVAIEKLKGLALSATANGSALAPESYTQPGAYVYTREVPASALTGESVKIDFQLDRAIPPSGGDLRELGIIVLNASLESK